MSAPPPPLPPPSGGGAAGAGAGDAVFFRRKDFKKTVTSEDGRQRRSTASIQIRKNKRTEALKKKRNIGADRPGGAGLTAEGAPAGAAPRLTTVPNEPTLDNLPHFAAAAQSEDPLAQFEGTKQIRRLLSKETDPPVMPVLEADVVGRLAEFLGRYDNEALQFEAAWALTNIASTEHTHIVVELGITPLLIKLLVSRNPDVREQCCWCLGNIAGDGHKYRDMVLAEENSIDHLVLNIAHPSSLSMLRNATWTLSNYCRGKPQPRVEHAKRILEVLVHLLSSTDTEVLTDTCWALSYLSDGEDDRIQTVVDAGAVPRLVTLMSHENTAVVNPALRAVGNIVTGNDRQTQTVIDSGALHAFVPLMNSQKKNIKKEACWAVSNVAAGQPAQVLQLTKVEGLIETVIQLLDRGEWKVRKEAAWAISNMTITGNPEHIRVLVEKGCIEPLCKLLDVKDNKIILVAMDALDAILKAAPDGSYADMVETADGVRLLDQLCVHKNTDVYNKANNVLSRHFPENGDVEEEVGQVAPAMATAADGTTMHYGFGAAGAMPTEGHYFGGGT